MKKFNRFLRENDFPYLGVSDGHINCQDGEELPDDAEIIGLSDRTTNVDSISRCKNIWKIDYHGRRLTQEAVNVMARLPKLRLLLIGTSADKQLPPLIRLKQLRALVVRCQKLDNLDFLSGMSKLQSLLLSELKHVPGLSGVEKLTDLRELVVEGYIDRKKYVPSLKPVASLLKLEYLCLSLGPGGADDTDVEALIKLKSLREWAINNAFSLDQLVRLKMNLPKLSGEGTTGSMLEGPAYLGMRRCPKCQTRLTVPVERNGKPFCGTCHPERLEKLRSRYDELMAEAQEALNRSQK